MNSSETGKAQGAFESLLLVGESVLEDVSSDGCHGVRRLSGIGLEVSGPVLRFAGYELRRGGKHTEGEGVRCEMKAHDKKRSESNTHTHP